ncbi:MAG: hypothetical protein EOP38_09865 [Rubrivivax sp.]|nr:MAG: hypothetical protein EOP38_09865 [Rubrivivax sp.]
MSTSKFKKRFGQLTEAYVLLPVVAAFLVGGIWFAAHAVISKEEGEARVTAVQSTQRLLDASEAQMLRALNEINQSFKLIEYGGAVGGNLKETLAQLGQKNLLLPDIMFTTSVVDRDGKFIASTKPANLSKSLSAITLKKHLGGDEVFVSIPEKRADDTEENVEISRTIGGAGANFTHVLVVRAPVSYFVSDYDEARFGKTGVLALIGTDGVIRAKRMGEVITAGQKVDFKEAAPKADEPETTATLVSSPWDKVVRYTAARKFFAFPLAVVVAQSESDRLAPARAEAEKHKLTASIATGLLLLVTAALTFLSWRLAQGRKREKQQALVLRKKTNDIQSMLQNMPQGVLTVVPGQTIHPEYSAYLETIFETKEIAGKNVMDLFFKDSSVGADAMSQVDAAIDSCIGEDSINYEFNSHLFVTEIDKTMADGSVKSLSLSWSPISLDDTVEKLMICVRDVTELKRLEKEAGEQKRELERIGQILAVTQEKFNEFIDGSLRFIEENRQLISQTRDKQADVANLLFRNMHTIKGNARTYGLTHMTDLVHETEQAYDDLRHNQDSVWQPEQLLAQLDGVKALVDEYARINEHMLGRKGPGRRGSVEKYLMVEKARVEHSLETLTTADQSDLVSMRSAINQVRHTLDLIGTERLDAILAGVVDSLPSLARELGKEAPVVAVEDHGIVVRNQIAPMLKNTFTHLLRNAVDHGLETIEERVAKGKPAAGRIEVDLSVTDGRMAIKLRDDGKGIAIGKLRATALARALMSPEEARSPHAVAMMIFAAGFSTATEVTQVSGRGVGMDAVKGFLEKEGGLVQIHFLDEQHDADFRPFELVISLPDKFAASLQAEAAFDNLRQRLSSAGIADARPAHQA